MNSLLQKISRLFALTVFIFFLNLEVSAEQIYIRKDANSDAAKADLEAMEKAMMQLRNTECSDPVSWYYQGAIHWVPSAPQRNPLCKPYTASSPSLLTSWRNCASHDRTKPEAGIHFLAWHRIYLYHFEKIIRKLSGDNNFAMPYWNYTSNTGRQSIPRLFQQSNSSLYEASRDASLNQGNLMATDVYELVIDSWAKIKGNSQFSVFNSSLNSGLHGDMHVYIGGDSEWNPIYQRNTGSGLMATVPSAGFDPIFWMHHSNLDRLWQQWTDSNRGKRMTFSELKSADWPYVFFDENGDKITYTMEQVYDMLYNLDYRYDDQPEKRLIAAQVLTEKPAKENLITSTVIARDVSAAGIQFNLILPASTAPTNVLALEALPEKSIVLELETSFQKLPHGTYVVYLNLPDGTSKEERRKYFVGSMSFFFNEPEADVKGQAKFHFDLTDELAHQVKTKNSIQNNLNITIINPFSSRQTENFTLDKVTIYSYE